MLSKKIIKKNNSQNKNEKGITLVALVITVVVMLILAGVAIAAVVDGDGLFNKARESAGIYENAAKDEGDTIQSMINQIDEYLVGKNPPAGEEIIENPLNQIVNVNQTFSGGTTGSYSDPIIPKGFAPINENDAIWGTNDGYQKGLVIEDESENQFVWVPVDGDEITFARQDFGFYWTGSFNDYSDPKNEELSNITESVTINGGFYIARYEAGLPEEASSSSVATNGSVRPVSKQRATVWNEIAWSDNGINDDATSGEGAVTVARSMYPEHPDSGYGVVSTLIYGVQWDTVLKFIGAYGGDTTYATDSTGKGNYSGTTNDPISELGNCGADPSFSQKNIYDMAGNVWEWTMEKYSAARVCRGGNYNDSGSDAPVSSRNDTSVDYGSSSLRFPCSTLCD